MHVSNFVMQAIIEKAAASGVAAATVYRQGHVGRVAAYPIMAAKAGLIGMMTADSGRSAKGVVPFGGREARLGTNPICFAIPSNLEGPLFIDMATSAVAAGKISLAVARGKSIPEGWILDKNGNATNDPHDFSDGGAILPLGGTEGHKGYGLAAIVEIFSGLLTGLGFGVDPTGRHNDGCFLAAFNVEAFRSLETFKQEVTEFAHYLKSTPPAKGFDEVYYPGEIEHLRTQSGLEHGIEVEESTWEKLLWRAGRLWRAGIPGLGAETAGKHPRSCSHGRADPATRVSWMAKILDSSLRSAAFGISPESCHAHNLESKWRWSLCRYRTEAGGWIPAFAGMTDSGNTLAIFVAKTGTVVSSGRSG